MAEGDESGCMGEGVQKKRDRLTQSLPNAVLVGVAAQLDYCTYYSRV